jgi:tripartite-type tricarboxylate transporter receptor subunit TctC
LTDVGVTDAARARNGPNYPAQPIPRQSLVCGGGRRYREPRIAEEAKKILGAPSSYRTSPARGDRRRQRVAAAKPDGYPTAPRRIARSCGPHIGSNSIRSTTRHLVFCRQRNFMWREDSPFRTFDDLLKFARDNPGKLTFSHAGGNDPTRLRASPKGSASFSSNRPGRRTDWFAVLGGHVMAGLRTPIPDQGGKVRATVIDGTKRMDNSPRSPRCRVLKARECDASPGMIIFGPKGVPPEVVKSSRTFHFAGRQLGGPPSGATTTRPTPWQNR